MTLGVIVSLSLFKSAYQESRYAVGDGRDKFLGDRRCEFADLLLEDLRHRVRPGETLCVLPEGIMVNYLARIESSSPFDSFIPPVLQMFDERTIVASFEAHPPDYVLLSHRDSPEYGAAYFGRDYAQKLSTWVMEALQSCHSLWSGLGERVRSHGPRSAGADGSIRSRGT